MNPFHLGCQTITWNNERAAKRDYTVRAVAEAGYEGLEIGARFLDLSRAREFKRVLDDRGIRLIALHTGWHPFLDADPAGAEAEIERIIDFARVTETPFLVMSGNQRRQEDEPAEIDGLNALGQECRDNGMVFCYHNHWWEIQHGHRLLDEIDRRTDPEVVSFCPDIGWIRKATADVLGTLGAIRSRIRLVHLKDYVAEGLETKDNETEFGQGILDFEEVFGFLRELPGKDLWIIAEQWKSSVNHLSPEAAIRANRCFLGRLSGA